MLAARTISPPVCGTRTRSVRVNAFKPVNTQSLVAAVTAGSLLLAGPSFASLPEGFKSPQGSNTADLEAKLDALIEQRTGKAEALPELVDVPEVKAAAPKPKEAPVVVAAPMAPAVAEPPAPARVAPEPAAAEAPAPVPQAPVERPKGLQVRSDSGPAQAAPAAPSNGLVIGGGVAVLSVVAAAALANNNSSAEGQAAAPAAAAGAAPAGDAAAPAESQEVASAAVGGAGETANPSSKAE